MTQTRPQTQTQRQTQTQAQKTQASKPAVFPSPLQSLILSTLASPPPLAHAPAYHALALQIQHNLEHQHAWTSLSLHTHSPLTGAVLARPLVSGLPPSRLYVHPDEQIEMLHEAERERRARGEGEGPLRVRAGLEREWVLPARLCERWTLRRLGDVFDGVGVLPPRLPSDTKEEERDNGWRTTKRVVLAVADSDSTVAYYIVQDGVVKPRQN